LCSHPRRHLRRRHRPLRCHRRLHHPHPRHPI
jgi:hypothetical protein